MKTNTLIIALLIFAILCFFYGVFRIVQTEIIFRTNLETVKNQLQQSKGGIVSMPRPDYYLAIIFSVFSLIVGIVIGVLIKQNH